MLTFLQYVGGFILAIIILLFIGYLYLKMKFGKLLGANSDNVPLMLHLNEELVIPRWLEKAKAINLIEQLENLGFEKGKAYRILEMHDVSLFSLFNKGYTAVIYTHPTMGLWTDIVFETKDEYHYTASNAPMGGELSSSPNDIKIFEPSSSAKELFSIIREQTQDKQAIFVSNENFRAFFEKAYKRDMAWKSSQGGISREEFDKIAKNSKIKITTENSEKAFIETKKQELDDWSLYGIVEFLKDKDEGDFKGDLFIVPENTHPCAFIEYMEEQEMIEYEQSEKLCKILKGESIESIFETINSALSLELRANKIGEISYPVNANVYLKKWMDY